MKVVDIALPDGLYDAFVIWAERDDDAVAIDLTLTTGARKGTVVSVRATRLDREPLDLVGLPCTLHVEAGEPRVTW